MNTKGSKGALRRLLNIPNCGEALQERGAKYAVRLATPQKMRLPETASVAVNPGKLRLGIETPRGKRPVKMIKR
jgi:hypothetical protein